MNGGFSKILSRITHHKGVFLVLALLLFIVVGGAAFFFTTQKGQTYKEVEDLVGVQWSFQEYSTYFRRLAEAEGAPYAFEVLKRAPFPPGIDIHLIGHVVGDMLYKQQGIEGITLCTPDFRNACSHSVVIGILSEHGEGSLSEIAETCKRAPGGPGAYTMCFHGLGHGVLAYNEYNFEKAVAMCAKTGTPEYRNREYIECVGGMTMEMIAGVHDRDAWEKQYDIFFKKNDPLALCNASYMSDEIRPICYIYLTPYLFEVAGMDLGRPEPFFYEKAFSSCSSIPKDRTAERDACYSGFGKEFIVLAQGRDVRDIGSMEAPALKDVRSWCKLANDDAGEQACNGSALASLFWGGENTPDASFRFCEVAESGDKSACYGQLGSHISFYLSKDPRKEMLCARFPEEYRSFCSSGTSL